MLLDYLNHIKILNKFY